MNCSLSNLSNKVLLITGCGVDRLDAYLSEVSVCDLIVSLDIGESIKIVKKYNEDMHFINP
ncbi:MAG: hypothetical protein ACTSR7_14910 [Promethearchaeota archaeon]